MKRGVKAIEGKRPAQAGRTEVRMEALRAAISFGTAEAVPLTWTRAAIVLTPYPPSFHV